MKRPSKETITTLVDTHCNIARSQIGQYSYLLEESNKLLLSLGTIKYHINKNKNKWVDVNKDSKAFNTLLNKNVDGKFAVMFKKSDEICLATWTGHNRNPGGWELISGHKYDIGLHLVMLLVPGHL